MVKHLQRPLMEVTDKIHSTLTIQNTKLDPKQRAQEVLKSFDEDFTNFLNIVEAKA